MIYQLKLTESLIKRFYKSRLQICGSTMEPPALTMISIKETIQELNASIPAKFTWHHMHSLAKHEQQMLCLTREWLFSQILLYVITSESKRKKPEPFTFEQYLIKMFGSTHLTSDIDVSIQGKHAYYIISLIEDAWIECTGHPSERWDVTFFADFFTYLDTEHHEVFLNSRGFYDSYDRILPYVGFSILQNAKSLEFPALNEFIQKHPEFPLQNKGWKEKAHALYGHIMKMSYNEKREKYYKYISRAEELRNTHLGKKIDHDTTMEIFISLAHATAYRAESYVLPSTVIFIVRDIQAGSLPPDQSSCKPYDVMRASCSLGKFTYICSALEQLGYMQRFKSNPKKFAKYKKRYIISMKRYYLYKNA